MERAALDAPADALLGEMVDTVGAGDTFDAGFVAGLSQGLDVRNALRLAVAAGALSVRGVGGAEGQPNQVEAARLAEHVRVSEE